MVLKYDGTRMTLISMMNAEKVLTTCSNQQPATNNKSYLNHKQPALSAFYFY